MAISDYYRLFSGNDFDKIEESGVSVEKTENVDAPIIKEYPLTAECKVLDISDAGLGEMKIIAEIVNISADESVLDDEENISVDKLQPISYDSVGKTYRLVGEVVGKAFHDSLKVKK